MISYLIEVTLCWAGFYLLYTLWLRNETFFRVNRWYLLGTLLLGLVIPVINPASLFSSGQQGINAIIIEPITITVQAFETTLEEIVITPKKDAAFDFQALFIIIYWLGVILLAAKFLYGLFKIYQLKKAGSIEYKSDYCLIKTQQTHLPFSFFKDLFWSEKVNFSREEAEKILKHELTHIRERHSIDVILLEIFSIFLWCSPIIFFYKKAIRNIHEYLADAAVLQNTPTRHYGHLLLRQSLSGLRIAQANNFIHSQLKKRIKMMTKNKSRQRSLLKYFSILPIALLLMLVLANKNAVTSPDLLLPSVSDVVATNDADLNKQLITGGPVDEMPRFPGCEDKADKDARKKCAFEQLIQYISKNLKYPEAAKKAGIEGKVVIGFTVQADGTLSNFSVAKTLGGGCDEEALRVCQTMPKWIPGKKEGKAVAVEMKLPIQFKLSAADKTDKADATQQNEELFKVVEDMPRFPGCEEVEDGNEKKLCAQNKMLQYIFKNLTYPPEAKDKGIQGTVIARFVIEKDGSISGAEIIRAIGSGCEEEVLRVVNSMPKWVPGKQRGKNVRVEFTLPIKFKLDDESKPADEPKATMDKLKVGGKDYYLLVDGEEVEDITEIKPDDIATINVYKGDEAVAQFGEKARNGVVSIRLKKNSENNILAPPANLPQGFEKYNDLKLEVFRVFPNPSDGKINIDLGPVNEATKIMIADAGGRVIGFEQVNPSANTIRLSDIDVSKAAKGNLYIIVEQEGKRLTEQIVLQ